jgi:hypothetical protein
VKGLLHVRPAKLQEGGIASAVALRQQAGWLTYGQQMIIEV